MALYSSAVSKGVGVLLAVDQGDGAGHLAELGRPVLVQEPDLGAEAHLRPARVE
jgi:hypothetical protein